MYDVTVRPRIKCAEGGVIISGITEEYQNSISVKGYYDVNNRKNTQNDSYLEY